MGSIYKKLVCNDGRYKEWLLDIEEVIRQWEKDNWHVEAYKMGKYILVIDYGLSIPVKVIIDIQQMLKLVSILNMSGNHCPKTKYIDPFGNVSYPTSWWSSRDGIDIIKERDEKIKELLK